MTTVDVEKQQAVTQLWFLITNTNNIQSNTVINDFINVYFLYRFVQRHVSGLVMRRQ